ncbi:MAG: TIGR01777 family protein, partial [Desulfobacterales bacterium]|nr:TIGR01777 family protein [Desulfobacterales bacterium]
MNILITGASGLVGSALVEFLHNKGHSIFSLQRNKTTSRSRFWNFERIASSDASAAHFDAVIHLAGENIATGRWTRRKKELILNSRVEGTRELAEYCAALPQKPKVFISASAIGFYGNQGDKILDESSASGTNFVADVCQQWEKAAQPAQNAGIRVVNGRIGMVLSGKGGTLKTMLPPFKLGIAGIVGDGTQYVSWVSIDDLISMFLFILETPSITGAVNLVSPEPATNFQFTKTLGKVVSRPTLIKMPA